MNTYSPPTRKRSTSPARLRFKIGNGGRNLYDLGRLMILQGCRPEELMALRKEHVDIEARRVKIAGGKTRAARRTLDLCNESVELIAARMGGESQWVFPSDRRAGRPIGKLQGPQ